MVFVDQNGLNCTCKDRRSRRDCATYFARDCRIQLNVFRIGCDTSLIANRKGPFGFEVTLEFDQQRRRATGGIADILQRTRWKFRGESVHSLKIDRFTASRRHRKGTVPSAKKMVVVKAPIIVMLGESDEFSQAE